MYIAARRALLSHRLVKYNNFTWAILGTVFTRIVVSYLNITNLVIFIIKILLYLYARHVVNLLYQILILPPWQGGSQQYVNLNIP